jgi:hypothetical protein
MEINYQGNELPGKGIIRERDYHGNELSEASHRNYQRQTFHLNIIVYERHFSVGVRSNTNFC